MIPRTSERGTTKMLLKTLPESQVQNLALTVLYVLYSVDCGPLYPTGTSSASATASKKIRGPVMREKEREREREREGGRER